MRRRFAFWIVVTALAAFGTAKAVMAEEADADSALLERIDALEAAVEEHRKAKDVAALGQDIDDLSSFWEKARANEKVSERVIDAMGDVAKATDDERLTSDAIDALGQTEDPRAAPHIKRFLRQRKDTEADLTLRSAVDAAGKVVDSSLVSPLLKIVEDSKHFGIAARAIESLGAYGRVARSRVKILEDLVKTVKKSKPGSLPRMRPGGSGNIDPQGNSDDGGNYPSDSGPTARWNALSRVLPEALCELTGQNVRSTSDWILLVGERKGKLQTIFRDRDPE